MTALDEASTSWELLPCAIVQLTPSGEAQHFNGAFTSLMGLEASRAHGVGWQARLAEGEAEPLLMALALEQHFEMQVRLELRPDVSAQIPTAAVPRWVGINAHYVAAEGHFLCVAYDVSGAKQAELAARAQAGQFQLLADNVPALIAYYETEHLSCVFANKEYAATFGWDPDDIVGRTFFEVIGAEAAAHIVPAVEQVRLQGKPVCYERELPSPWGGRSRWLEVNLLPHTRQAGGAVIGVFVLIADITKYRLAENAVRESEERLDKFLRASAEGIVFHQHGQIHDANPALCDMIGYSLEELRGRRTLDFVGPGHVEQVAAMIASGREMTYESTIVHRDGRIIPVEFIVRTMQRGDEQVRMTIVRDIRDRQAAQARIYHLAHHDVLTGLPNRASFIEHLDRLLQCSASTGSAMALLFIDLDHFKRVNDSLGHLAGDALLRTVAQRITQCLRGTDLVGRFGGDEFLVLLADSPSRDDIEEVGAKLLRAVEAPVMVDGRLISVSPSIGVAMGPTDGSSAEQLIQHADAAMYEAKARGRAMLQFFDPAMAQAAYRALVMESELSQALVRHEFVLHYQPQLRASDGQVVGAEALIRWRHPERGLINPDEFIPLAEQRRLMVAVGRWVLEEAARTAKRWHQLGLPLLPVAVNLSNVQFHATDFVQTVEEVLREQAVQGAWLELELTERMLMEDVGAATAALVRLKSLGLRISVDDFGTGYTSLAHLKALPIDKMKIDRTFVKDLPQDQGSGAIAHAIIQMARSLGMTVIAEGVENAGQREFLTRHGCHELQGHAMCPPMSRDDIEAWLAEGQTAPVAAL